MRQVLRRFVATLATGLVALAVAQPAGAQTPSLTGETFFAGFTLQLNANCNPEGVSTISYRATGAAAGPYPGSFVETGTVTIGPHTPPLTGPGGFPVAPAGQVLDWDAHFTINAPNGQVTGDKHFAQGLVGQCISFEHATIFRFTDASGFVRQAGAGLRYEALIRTSTGTFRDEGRSSVTFLYSEVSQATLGSRTDSGFGEFFFSTSLIPVGPAAVAVTPKTAINPVGSRHTLTATVTNALGDPVQGTRVIFTVTGSVTKTGSCVTDQDGRCDFSYQGPTFPGADVIVACADSDNDGRADPGEPCDEATKEWVLPASTPGQTTGGGQILHLASTGTTFGFTFSSDENGLKGQCEVLDHAPAVDKVNCLNVLAYVQTANEATIYGNATVNGEDAGLFRLHVVDNGESGIGKDVFEFETQSGYVRAGLLTQGDVQVHPAAGP